MLGSCQELSVMVGPQKSSVANLSSKNHPFDELQMVVLHNQKTRRRSLQSVDLGGWDIRLSQTFAFSPPKSLRLGFFPRKCPRQLLP